MCERSAAAVCLPGHTIAPDAGADNAREAIAPSHLREKPRAWETVSGFHFRHSLDREEKDGVPAELIDKQILHEVIL